MQKVASGSLLPLRGSPRRYADPACRRAAFW